MPTTTITTWCRPLITQVLALYPVDGLTANWVEAIVRAESSGQPHAYRFEPRYWDRYCAGHPVFGEGEPFRIAASYGLMQILYPTAYSVGYRGEPEGLFVPQQSLLYGVKVLAQNLAWAKGHLPAALAAYNGGRTKDNLTPPYRNGIYLRKVAKHHTDILEGH
jgi:soluble lytic murein transglycosylase-like protein